MKVLHGMSEVAGQGIYSVQGLQYNGIDANMVVWRKNAGGYDVDIDLKIGKEKSKYPFYGIKMGAFALKALRSYDIYHFHFGYSLMPYHLDLPFIKFLKKDYFVEFHGSELRFLFNDISYEYLGNHWDDQKVRQKAQRQISKLLKGAKAIILHDIELKKHLPSDIDIPVYIVPLRIDIGKFKPEYPDMQINKPIIVHAPSKRSTKGTDRILKELEKVNGEFELILVEGKAQQEAFEFYKKADIIIDQISGGTYGVFAIEGMALGKPVVTYIDDEMIQSFPETMPIISCNFNDFRKTVENLIVNPKMRHDLGVAGRKYVERYHDNKKVTKYLAEIYKGQIKDLNLFNIL